MDNQPYASQPSDTAATSPMTGTPMDNATPAPTFGGTPTVPPTDFGAPATPAATDGGDSFASNGARTPADEPSTTVGSSAVSGSTDSAAPAVAIAAVSDNDLLSLKQQALTQLSPLTQHLEQTPEDEFRTVMMMIQASDNKDLLPKAYAAAQKITDEKEKAQALLDVVNEINYFTRHLQGQQPEVFGDN